MNLTRCENGHFYDADRFPACPHCNQTSVSTVLQDENGEKQYTLPINPPDNSGGLADIVMHVKPSEDDFVSTVGYYGDISTDPVVGWLVSIEGSNFGEGFKLKTGKNFIGRSAEMDISLSSDKSVSRTKHAIILYEPKSNVFFVQPGEAKELFYLNEKVVLSTVEINAYDVLQLGGTKLLFIPLCTEKFNWDAVRPKEEEEKNK